MMTHDELAKIIALIPDEGRNRDDFISLLEQTWGGIWLSLRGYQGSHATQVLQAALDYASAADPDAAELFLFTANSPAPAA